MPAYTYEAVDAEGRAQRGLLEADTVRAARTQLRQRGLIPLNVTSAIDSTHPTSGHGTGLTRIFHRSPPRRLFCHFDA